MQLTLAFLEIPSPRTLDNLDDAQRAAVLDVLARLIVQTVQLDPNPEDNDND